MTLARISGQFRAELGSEEPGIGRLTTLTAEVFDHAVVAVHEVPGAACPVVQVRIGGSAPAGPLELELDIAANHWLAGTVTVDGTEAVGQLTTPDGVLRYVVGGVIDVTSAGLAEGAVVEGSFDNLVIAEVSR